MHIHSTFCVLHLLEIGVERLVALEAVEALLVPVGLARRLPLRLEDLFKREKKGALKIRKYLHKLEHSSSKPAFRLRRGLRGEMACG